MGPSCDKCGFQLARNPTDTECADAGSDFTQILLSGETLCDENRTCSGHGICRNDTLCECSSNNISGAACDVCAASRTGSDCSDQCNWNSTCGTSGRCDGRNGCICYSTGVGEQCMECTVGAYGTNCDLSCDKDETCSGHGRCTFDGGCVCDEGFAGLACDTCLTSRFGDSCDLTCSDDTCNGHGSCGHTGMCECDQGWVGHDCTICAGSYGTDGTCDTKCLANQTCWGSGRCKNDGTCECFPDFDCTGLYSTLEVTLDSGILGNSGHDSICDDSKETECIDGCSAGELQHCEDSFQICLEALGMSEGRCECLGRFKKCSVHAGCDQMTSVAVSTLCRRVGCTEAQCQSAYPQATQCDWDNHAECEWNLEQCLLLPNSTIMNSSSYAVGDLGLHRWLGDPFHVEQAKFAQRCSCYDQTREIFSQADGLPGTCSGDFQVGRWQDQDPVIRTNANKSLSWIETRGPIWISGNYVKSACLSECTNAEDRAERNSLIAFDCAICGDGELMLGREECDDGNTDPFDGCHECRIEPPDLTNFAAIFSNPSPSPGSIMLVWNHTLKAVQASQRSLPHRVVRYDIYVQRKVCPDCEGSEFVFSLPYEHCQDVASGLVWEDAGLTLPSWGQEFTNPRLAEILLSRTELSEREWLACGIDNLRLSHFIKVRNNYFKPARNGSSVYSARGFSINSTWDCSFLISDLVGGEYVGMQLGAVNVAGMSGQLWTNGTPETIAELPSLAMRWTNLPSGDVKLQEIEPVPQEKVQVIWNAPSDTGFRNSHEVPILKYRLEVSSCSDFTFDDPVCTTWSEDVEPTHPGVERNNSNVSVQNANASDHGTGYFQYPVRFNVPYDLHPGFYYYYRITPFNERGAAKFLEKRIYQLGSLPFEKPMVQFPIELPIPIAVTTSIQIWQGQSLAHPADSSLLQILGFPVVRNVTDVVLTYFADEDMNPFGEVLTEESLIVESSTLDKGTRFTFKPPQVSNSTLSTCGPCIFTVNVRFVKWSAKSVSFSIQYFMYPKGSILGINPYNGPIQGGTLINLLIKDYEGPRTKAGAGLNTLFAAVFDDRPMSIEFSVQGSKSLVSDFHPHNITLGRLQDDSSRTFHLHVPFPASPTNKAGVAIIRILVSGEEIAFNEDQAQLRFEYIGAKILSLIPASAYLNPGSGGATVSLNVANLGRGLTPKIAFNGKPAPVTSMADPVPNDLGTVTSIKVSVPEMPFSDVGAVNVTLWHSTLEETLESVFEYAMPPRPVIDVDSISIAGNKALWAPASAKGYAGSLIIENLSPKYGISYDEVSLFFASKSATVNGYLQLGADSKITFTTPDRMAPGLVSCNVTVLKEGQVVASIMNFANGDQFVIQFRDLSEPRVLGIAPTEGPARGGTILMVSMLSFTELIASGSVEAKIGTSNVTMIPTVLGVMSVQDWEERNVEYDTIISIPVISEFLVGVNDGTQQEINSLVSETISAIEQESFDPDVGKAEAGFAFLQLPSATVHGRRLMSNTLKTEVSVTVGNITVKSSFVYVAPPQGVARVSAATERGDLVVGLDGNARITVLLSNFEIVYKPRDITVLLGDFELQVARLLYSTRDETKLYVTAPRNSAGLFNMKLSNKYAASNTAEITVEYVDLRVPEVTSFYPSLLYQTGGEVITAVVSLLPAVEIETLEIDFFSISSSSMAKMASISPTHLVREGGIPPEDTAYVTFTAPAGIIGRAQFVIRAGGKASTCPETKQTCQTFEYLKLPMTPPALKQFSPSVASSLGGTSMSISLTNFREVEDVSDIRIHLQVGQSGNPLCSQNTSSLHCFRAGIQWSLSSRLQLVSNKIETRITFVAPAIPDHMGGQIGQLRIWDVKNHTNSTLAGIMPIYFRDDSIAEVIYLYPSSVKADRISAIEVFVKRIGQISDADQINVFVAYDSSCNIWSEVAGMGSICVLNNGPEESKNSLSTNYELLNTAVTTGNGGLVVKFQVYNKNAQVGKINITVANCERIKLATDACSKKTVTFTLDFRHPQAPFIELVEPLSVSTDGRVPVNIFVDNLPASASTTNILAEFQTNATIIAIDIRAATDFAGLNRAVVTVLAPSSASAGTSTPSLRIPTLSISLKFPQDFSYKMPPFPTLSSFNPSSASLTAASPVRLLVQNFPGVTSASDIVVEFKWPGQDPAQVSVVGYMQVDNTKFVTAIQDYFIDVDSPTGSFVKEGTVGVTVYHIGYRSRSSTKSGFKFIDITLPQVDNMRTDAATSGVDSVLVQMSKSTEVTISVKNAREPIFAIQVDGKARDLMLRQYFASQRVARAVFSSSARASKDTIYGFVLFSSSCEATCTSACCEASTCAKVCGCRTSCFKLVYYDDLAPKVSLVTGTIGTEMGGTAVSIKIHNFPVVEPSQDVSAQVGALFDSAMNARVFVQSSSKSETSLVVETTEIDLRGQLSRTVLLQIYLISNPSQTVSIDYLVKESVPAVTGLVLPSRGTDKGGVLTSVRIKYFPYPTECIIQFGEVSVNETSITVSAASTKQMSTISFFTPATGPGVFTVRVTPKVCPNCGKNVEFSFTQVDSSLPVVLEPLPRGGPFQETVGSTKTMNVAPFPKSPIPGYSALTVSCVGQGIVVAPVEVVSVSQVDEQASIVFTRPSANNVGNAVCTLTVTTGGKLKSGTFNYQFYDGTLLRLAQIEPRQIATRLSVYGRFLDLLQPVKFTFFNLQQGLAKEELSVMVGAAVPATVLSVSDVVSCAPTAIDCNQTEITIVSVAQDVARNVRVDLTITGSEDPIDLLLPYFKACDYENFCSGKDMLVDSQRLAASVPTNSHCDVIFCVDPSSPDFPTPSLKSILPSEGPATGGTTVQAYFDNFPAFGTEDVIVLVGSGASSVFAKVISVSNPGGTLLSSSGTLQFETPSTSNTDAVTQLPVDFLVYVGSVSLSVTAQFVFTPVPTGRAVLSTMFPTSIFSEADNVVTVQLTNFPFIPSTGEGNLIKAKFEGQVISANAITSSTYESTLATFSLRGVISGSRLLEIYFNTHGQSRAARTEITVLPPVQPEVESVFPLTGIAGQDLSLSVTVKYMPPELRENDFDASIVAGGTIGDLDVGDAIIQTPDGCTDRVCAKVTIPIMIGKGKVAAAGGDIKIRIQSLLSTSENVDFDFTFERDTTPQLLSIDPKSVSVDDVASTVLKIFVSNVDSSFCNAGSSCVASFTFGQGQSARTRNGVVQSASESNGLRTVFVQPPSAPNGKGGVASVLIKEGVVQVSSTIFFSIPNAGLEPIDAPCAGGAHITVSAVGFAKIVTSPQQVSVDVGGSKATVGEILSSTMNDDMSLTKFTITVPTLSESKVISGAATFESSVVAFTMECFSEPIAVVSPDFASVNGKTSSEDGHSVTVTVRNFPAIQSSQDLSVQFGTIVCGGTECNILSYQNTADRLEVLLSVPQVAKAQEVVLMVDYVGQALPPQGGDPSGVYIRSRKFFTLPFQFVVPAPVALSVLFCEVCNTESKCIVNGACFGGQTPISNKLGMSGEGVLTVMIDNVGGIPSNALTGEIDERAAVTVQFGDYPGVLQRILLTDIEPYGRSAFEIALNSPAQAGQVTAEVIIQKDITKPTVSIASFTVNIYNENIQLSCHAGCRGQVQPAHAVRVNVSNAVIDNTAISDTYVFLVAGVAATDVRLEYKDSTVAVFRLMPPSYTCPSCYTSDGRALVDFVFAYKSTRSVIASAMYTYWAPPRIESLRFEQTGGKLLMRFDQQTNRAMMTASQANCSYLFDTKFVNSFGTSTKCVWQSDWVLEIELGASATIVPGSPIAILEKAGLKSKNQISAASSASALCVAPKARVPPNLEIKVPDTIDPCAPLEMRATAVSSRPSSLKFVWSCINDDPLNDFLKTQSGDTVYMNPGTSHMTSMDKTYQISVSVTDFLGSTSDTLVAKVLKKSSPTPQIQFNPPGLEITRGTGEVSIIGEAVFSSCPVPQEDLIFSWRQVSGPTLRETIELNEQGGTLASTFLPTLQIKKTFLVEGSTYQFALKLSMSTDRSKTSESIFLLKVGYQGLEAAIEGGETTVVSSDDALELSAAPSRDKDMDRTADQGLHFSWACAFVVNGVKDACRNITGLPLVFARYEQISVDPGLLPVAPFPYSFTVSVTKPGRPPVTSTKHVYVRMGQIPRVSVDGGALQQDGSLGGPRRSSALYVPSSSRIILTANVDRPRCRAPSIKCPRIDGFQYLLNHSLLWATSGPNGSRPCNITDNNCTAPLICSKNESYTVQNSIQVNTTVLNATSGVRINTTVIEYVQETKFRWLEQQPIYDPGIVQDCVETYHWTFEPPLDTAAIDVPFGFQGHDVDGKNTFVLNGAPHILRTGNTYVLTLSARLKSGEFGLSTLSIVVNSPPTSGTFGACLAKPGQTGCLKTGKPVEEEFRVSCAGWVDSDLPLEFQFGYAIEYQTGKLVKTIENGWNQSNLNQTREVSAAENATDETWYKPGADNTRDIAFPLGRVTLMAYVFDGVGARTDLLTDVIVTSEALPGGRRLMATMSFAEKAKAKLKASLQTFRTDKINQMASALGGSGGMSTDMSGNVLNTMAAGTSRSAPSLGGQCESFSAAKAVAKSPSNLGLSAVGGMAAMMKNMLKSKLKGSIPLACAANAAGSMGGSLRAQAMYKKANPDQSMMTSVSGAEFMQSLEAGMKSVMSQAVYDAVVGEGPRLVSLESAEHNVNRVSASQLKLGATYEKWSHPVPSMFTTTTGGIGIATIQLPETFTTDLFGSTVPDLDIHTQSHGYAPDASGFRLKSPLVGLTVSYAKAISPIEVANLSNPVMVTIPVDTSDLLPQQRLIFAQQVQCVFWDNDTYSNYGCNVSSASIFEVTCLCTHLTLFAVNWDTSARACGDGIMQEGETCDDINAFNRDGCSDTCQVEPDCECTGAPSSCKCTKSVTANRPELAGVKASLVLRGFNSLLDFLNAQAEFQAAIATATRIPGLGAADVVVLRVCFASEPCKIFWEVESRRKLQLHRRAAAGEIEVDFFINKGDAADPTAIYVALTAASFINDFIAALSADTGRTISAEFSGSIQIVEDGGAFDKPGFGSFGGKDANFSVSSIFENTDDPLDGLSGWVAYVLIGLCGAAGLFFCIVSCLVPLSKEFYKHFLYKAETETHDRLKQHKIHPQVIQDMKAEANSWKKKGQDNSDDEDDAHIFDAPESDVDDLETEMSPDGERAGNVHGELDDEDDGKSTSLWPGATSSVLQDNLKDSGRWKHARSRLKALEMQLDELLESLPKVEEDDEATVARANALMAEAGAPRERPQYHRPAVPDLSTAPLGVTLESQPIRRVRRAGADQQALSGSVSTVRRAPKLLAIMDGAHDLQDANREGEQRQKGKGKGHKV